MQIACLHTSHINIEVFNDTLRDLGLKDVALRHSVRPDILAAVERAGGALTQQITTDTLAALHALTGQADAVLLACSTLAPLVSEAQKNIHVPVMRPDEALAEEAFRQGGKIVVLYTLAATQVSTDALFSKIAKKYRAKFDLRFIPGAWDLFKAGDSEAYHARVAAFADAAYGEGATVVALAQATMAPAAKLCRKGHPLTSPAAGLRAVLSAVKRG